MTRGMTSSRFSQQKSTSGIQVLVRRGVSEPSSALGAAGMSWGQLSPGPEAVDWEGTKS